MEEILATQKAEPKCMLATWSELGSAVTKRRIDEIHETIEACHIVLKSSN